MAVSNGRFLLAIYAALAIPFVLTSLDTIPEARKHEEFIFLGYAGFRNLDDSQWVIDTSKGHLRITGLSLIKTESSYQSVADTDGFKKGKTYCALTRRNGFVEDVVEYIMRTRRTPEREVWIAEEKMLGVECPILL